MRFLTPANWSPVRSAIGFAFLPGLDGIGDWYRAGLGLAPSVAGSWVRLASGIRGIEAGLVLCLANKPWSSFSRSFGALTAAGKSSNIGTGFSRN